MLRSTYDLSILKNTIKDVIKLTIKKCDPSLESCNHYLWSSRKGHGNIKVFRVKSLALLSVMSMPL